MPTTTFVIGEDGTSNVIDCLRSIGFAFSPPKIVRRTLLDTFDGRLHRAGLRLELAESTGLELSLAGGNTATARLSVPSPPRLHTDLPPGPLRTRLAAIIDVRAVLPRIRVTSRTTEGAWRNDSGVIVGRATLHEALRVDGHDIDLPVSTIEIQQVKGYGKRARAAIDALQRLELVCLDADTLTVAAIAAGVDLGGVTGSPTVPLDPAMAAIDGFRAVLANLAETIVANRQGTIDEVDPEFLHDFRVAVRRTRSVLGQGKKVLPKAIGERARLGFARLSVLTGPARDLDVYLIEWQRYTGPLGAKAITALEPVRTLLAERRYAAHAALAEGLRSAEFDELMLMWRTWLVEPLTDPHPDRHGGRHPSLLGTVAAKQITRAQDTLVEHGRLITPDTPAEQVHDLRKDAKKLRYLFECFGSLLPDGPRKAFVQRLKALQDNLGEHQDAEVHLGELNAISAAFREQGAPSQTIRAIGLLAERLDERRIATRGEFAERFADYDSEATVSDLSDALEALR
jgi:CHAD domain-containing protein